MLNALLAFRILAAAPLLLIGLQHLSGAAPMLPILEGAGFPSPELGAIVAPIVEVAGGLLLLIGLFARLGGLLAIGSMAGALYAHLTFNWADEPPLLLPIAVLVFASLVVFGGPGRFALGSRTTAAPA